MIRRLHPAVLAAALLVLLPAAALAAGTVVRVPQDAAGLAQALDRVPEGGVIELAAGRYPSPERGFDLANGKSFTLRAARGAQVVLDGGNARPIVRLRYSRQRGKQVTFEGIAFENAATTAETEGGAVSLAAVQARFVGCRFQNNTASGPTTGGGAVGVTAGSDAAFVGCEFRSNSSRHRGGALAVIGSTASLVGGSFTGNRTNIAGHSAGSSGGAVYALDSTVRIDGVRFEGNEAGYAGGALYGFGGWRAPESVPHADLLVTGSSFTGNRAVPNPCCQPPGPTVGGAIHIEDQTTLRVVRSRFTGNEASLGGAIDNYRSIVDVEGSVFQGNRAPLDAATGVSAGGALFASSSDFVDPSTGGGAINRRPAQVDVRDTLFQGRFGAVGATAKGGGCFYADGDGNRVYGDLGVPRLGTVADNRARVHLSGVVFSDCDVAGASTADDSFGGALWADLVDLTMERCLVIGSDARGVGAAGGGLTLRRQTAAHITDSTFAGNTAETAGGAINLNGADLVAERSAFFGNEVSPGVAELAQQSRGAAIYSIPLASRQDPTRARGVGGVIASSLFTGNLGLALFDVEGPDGPLNEVRYNGNRFFERSFGAKVYANTLVDRDGTEVAGLNALTVVRPGGPSTRKSEVPNQELGAAPSAGALLAVPAGAGAAGDQAPGFLGYAWSGRGASLNGPGTAQPLAARFGLVQAGAAGERRLIVDGAQVAAATVAAAGCTSGPTLCLADGRFRLEVRWEDFSHRTGSGRAVALTRDTGYFWFFDAANVELVVKVIDARSLDGNFWVFYGALSSVAYTLTVTDTATGRTRTYTNPAGKLGSVADTTAFPGNGVAAAASAVLAEGAEGSAGVVAAADPGSVSGNGGGESGALAGAPGEAAGLSALADEAAAGNCTAGPTALCLNGNRFRAELTWKDFQGHTGVGRAVALTPDTGYFWFFSEQNVEVVVKVIDGRGLNGNFWVFYGALSSVEYTLTVTDTVTKSTATYHNPPGKLASVADTAALPGG